MHPIIGVRIIHTLYITVNDDGTASVLIGKVGGGGETFIIWLLEPIPKRFIRLRRSMCYTTLSISSQWSPLIPLEWKKTTLKTLQACTWWWVPVDKSFNFQPQPLSMKSHLAFLVHCFKAMSMVFGKDLLRRLKLLLGLLKLLLRRH